MKRPATKHSMHACKYRITAGEGEVRNYKKT